ncbi:hypothetical protein V8G54_027231 [Vigna mungo]|uniref:Uncharacterized protein n=1 Tax=Vigna mungo TaxID=3915 RepID=A0AAQ3N255_VIGMU
MYWSTCCSALLLKGVRISRSTKKIRLTEILVHVQHHKSNVGNNGLPNIIRMDRGLSPNIIIGLPKGFSLGSMENHKKQYMSRFSICVSAETYTDKINLEYI